MNTRTAAFALVASTLAAGSALAGTRTIELTDATVRGANLDYSSFTVDTDSSEAIVSATAVAVLGVHGDYLSCDNGGGGDLDNDSDDIGSYETFILLTFDDGKVSLRTRGGKYVQAKSGGGSYVNCEGAWAHGYERWSKTENADGTFTFAASNGRYMTAQVNGEVNASASAIGSYEKFSVIDLGATGMDATPDFRIQFEDLNGDGSEEMILMVEQEDGSGFLMADPLGIFDTLGKLGYDRSSGLDFWNGLSTTQRTALRTQLNSSGVNYGSTIDGNELRAFLARMGGTRTYGSVEYEQIVDVTALSVSTCDSSGNFCTSASVGDYDILIGPNGFEAAVTVASVSASAGPVTATVNVGQLESAVYVDSNGVAFGGQVTLIGVETGIGKENGTYVGVSAGLSAGFYADVRFGRGDQYGFTLELPVIPVGVSLYVKGEDAVWLWDEVSGWSVGAADTVADGAVAAWETSIGFAENASGNIACAVSETFNDSRSTLQVAGNDVAAGVSDGADEVVAVYKDASNSITSTVDAVGDALTDAANGVANAVSDATNSIASAAENVVDSVGSFFKDLF